MTPFKALFWHYKTIKDAIIERDVINDLKDTVFDNLLV